MLPFHVILHSTLPSYPKLPIGTFSTFPATVSIDAGLHRSADTYDLFDPIEDEIRKRTFWCVYLWDKQLSAHFRRPRIIRLRDCDVGEPAAVDDEFITKDGLGVPPLGTECRMTAFISAIRIMAVLESVTDVPPIHQSSSPFLARATARRSRCPDYPNRKTQICLINTVEMEYDGRFALPGSN
ncbi:hypothetical protein FB446DRAFT_822305 [Lentinula raphanica]|nr:hypothetical protein FB446DRAFT_822305 [Lentinula raphanica]